MPELNEALQAIRASLKSDNPKTGNPSDEIEIAVSDLANSDLRPPASKVNISVSPSISGFSASDIQRTVSRAVYQFSPSSFFQVNACLLDEFVKEAIGAQTGDFALDLYAGVGLFTIQLARHFNRVIGIECCTVIGIRDIQLLQHITESSTVFGDIHTVE